MGTLRFMNSVTLVKLVNPVMIMMMMMMMIFIILNIIIMMLIIMISMMMMIGIADYRESGAGSLSISGEGGGLLLSAINSPLRVIVSGVIIIDIIDIIYSIVIIVTIA